MKKEYFYFSVCGAVALRAVLLPEWSVTVSFLIAASLCGLSAFFDFKSKTKEKDEEVTHLKAEIGKVSDRVSKMSMKIGLK